MTDDKIYTPEILEDTPFPGQEKESLSDTQKGSDTTEYSPSTIKQQPVPRRLIAHELLNQRLNTKTGNILGQFNFQPSGALQIGKHIYGESGDIRISPNGIVARDMFGINTIAIDGETGDAVFRGTVMANDFIVSDENGIRSLGNFTTTDTSQSGLNQVFSTTSYVDVTNSSLSFTLDRDSLIIFLIKTEAYLTESAGNTGDGIVSLNIDGVIDSFTDQSFRSGNNYLSSRMSYRIRQLSAGPHTIKLQGKLETIYAGAPTWTLRTFVWSYLKLGN